MKRLALIFLAALLSAPLAQNVFCLEVPPLTGPVMDTAGIMSDEKRAELEGYLLRIDQNSSAQIVVLTIPSLQGEGLEEYSLKAAREWRLGNAEDNKGVLLLVAYKEKKIRIETGYGAEGDLTDTRCGLIIRNIIAPDFQDGDYSRGIIRGAKAIAASVAPEVETEAVSLEEEEDSPIQTAAALLIFFSLYFFMFSGCLATKFSFLHWLPWASWFIRKSNGPRTGSQKFWDEYYGGHLRSTGFGRSGFAGSGFSGHGGSFGGGGASGGW